MPSSRRKALAAIVERCLATSPEDRFPSAAELKAHLDAVVAGDPLPLPRRRRAAWRRRQPVAAVAIVVAVLAAAGVYLAQPPADPQARSVQPAREDPLPADNLLLQAEQMVARLEANVVKSDLPATRSAAASLVEALDREQLLSTTPTGLMLLARYTQFLNTAFGAEGRDESDALLARRVESPETLLAVDPTAGAMLLLETMFLPLSRNQPDAALAVSAVLEEHGILQMGGEPVGRWAMLTSEALLRSGQLDEAFATLAKVVDRPGELPARWRMGLLADQAMIREQQGREEDAIAILWPHLKAQLPESRDEAHFAYKMHLQAGRCFLKLRQPEQAMPLLQHAVALMGPWPDAVPRDAAVVAYLHLGEAQEGVGDPGAAAASYRAALANLRQLAGTGDLPEAMLTELGPELQERIDRLEPGMSDLVVE